MGKNSKIDPVGIVSNKHWISAVLDACPAADPNWGALKKASQALLDVVSKQTRPKLSSMGEVSWDAADFADQLSVLLFHFRKVCTNPGRYFAAIEDCKSHGMDADCLHDLSGRFEPMYVRSSTMDGFGHFKLNDDEKKLVNQVKEKIKQK